MSPGLERCSARNLVLWVAAVVLATPNFLWAQRSLPSKAHPSLGKRFDEVGLNGQVKAWVFFEESKGFPDDPNALDAAIRGLTTRYNPRAIQRRIRRRTLPGLFDIHDLPVPQSYLDAVAKTGAIVHVASKWVNGASVTATFSQIKAIADLPFVTKIQPVRRGRRLPLEGVVQGKPGAPSAPEARNEKKLRNRTESESVQTPRRGRRTPSSSTSAGPSFYGEAEEQLAQVNLTTLHTQGFTGAGVIIGILDTGFRRTHEVFNEPGHPVSVITEWDFINDDGNTANEGGDNPSQHNHGTYILGVLGAYQPNVLVGGAYDASFVLCKTEDITAEYRGEEDNYVAGLEFIEANGGDMATASLGYSDFDDPAESYADEDFDGLTAVTTIGVNIARGNGVHCCNSVGNGGHDADPETWTIVAPADAFEVIAVGAVDSTGMIAGFSSSGPTADGRVKPEVLARGVDTRTVSALDDIDLVGVGGTSLSAPIVAAAVACLTQAHPDWTVEQMRRYLTRTASDYVINDTFDPTFVRGYGIIDAAAAAAADCNDNSTDDAIDISNGTSRDCNANGIPDQCDIADGTSVDADENGVPDECPHLPIPTVSQWGMLAMTAMLLSAGVGVIRKKGQIDDLPSRSPTA